MNNKSGYRRMVGYERYDDGQLPCCHFDSLCRLTFSLVKLMQNECKHLCVENIAHKILGRLISEYTINTKKT